MILEEKKKALLKIIQILDKDTHLNLDPLLLHRFVFVLNEMSKKHNFENPLNFEFEGTPYGPFSRELRKGIIYLVNKGFLEFKGNVLFLSDKSSKMGFSFKKDEEFSNTIKRVIKWYSMKKSDLIKLFPLKSLSKTLL